MTVFTQKLATAIPAMLLCASLSGVTNMSYADTTNPTAPVSLAIDGVVAIKVSGYDFRRELGLLIDPAWFAQPEMEPRLSRALPAIQRAAAGWQETRVNG